MRHVVALFGESEKGDWDKPHVVSTLGQLVDRLGHPPPESAGLFFAIQALLFERELIFFRVESEGYSKKDYLLGLRLLCKREKIKAIHALCLPGVGDREILDASAPVCHLFKSHLITTEKDLYDYLTHC
ncbi:MAG: hypothetical protein RL235_638 [Chlamydiota bacterium]